jgi:hypothetical protein
MDGDPEGRFSANFRAKMPAFGTELAIMVKSGVVLAAVGVSPVETR